MAGWPAGDDTSAFSEVQLLRCGMIGVMGDIVPTRMGSGWRARGEAAPCEGRVIGLSVVERFGSPVALPALFSALLDRCWAGPSLSVLSRLFCRLRQAA